jgi:hypothetical protein
MKPASILDALLVRAFFLTINLFIRDQICFVNMILYNINKALRIKTILVSHTM